MTTESASAIPADHARQRGGREYYSHRGEYRNPFPTGSDAYNEYERGWMQSLRRDDGKLVPFANADPLPELKHASPPSDYNAYAELKGRSRPRR